MFIVTISIQESFDILFQVWLLFFLYYLQLFEPFIICFGEDICVWKVILF